MKPTVQQQKVIDAKCGNILVSAAAGSGKTSVMTERIVGRIIRGELDIRNVLVMTFTDAAAKNMREKIEKNLRKSLAETAKPDKKRFISRQITYLGQSNISTIHSFCLEVIRNFYYDAIDENGDLLLEPGFRIADPQESGLLLAGALDELFEKEYIKCDESPESEDSRAFLLLVDAYSGFRSDRSAKDLIIQFYHFLRSMPDYEEWVQQQKRVIHEVIDDFDNSQCFKSILESLGLRVAIAKMGLADIKGYLGKDIAFYKENKANLQKNSDANDAFRAFVIHMEEMFGLLEKENLTWDDLHTHFMKTPAVPKLRMYPASDSFEKTEFWSLFKTHFTELIYYTTGDFGTKTYSQDFIFARKFVFTKTKDEITSEIREMYPAIECFMDLALALDSEYTKVKQNANMIDFGDFEHLALRILRLKGASEYYKDKFKEIYIDEYQDTSSIQEAILQLVSTSNSFMVGDVKQSIYKFRHAKPQIFMGKYDLFKNPENLSVEETAKKDTENESAHKTQTPGKAVDTAIDSIGTVFELNRNFRSSDIILEAVNEVFCRIMSKEAGEIDYNIDHAFIVGITGEDTNHPSVVKQETKPEEVNLQEDKLQEAINQNYEQPDVVTTEKIRISPLIEIFLTDISPKAENKGENSNEDEDNSGISSQNTGESDSLYKPSGDTELSSDDAAVNEEENGFNVNGDESPLAGTDASGAEKTETIAKDELTKYEKEALSVAIEINRLITKEGQRPGDIAILSRTGAICGVFADALAAMNIPYACDQSMVFLERYELKVIEALLYVLDNPMQDIPLAGVLSSPLFECSLDEEEMLKIRIFGKGFKFFYECVQHYKENGDDETIRQKIVEFYERISQIRESLLHSTVSELVENIFETSGLMSYAAAMPQGEDVIRSLEDFLEWVRSIDDSRHSDLHSFVRLMQDIRQKSPDSSPFGAQESLSDSVKVITMHRSKGLEYEIVFLAGNNRQLSSKDTKAPILISEKMGIGFDYVNVLEQYKYPTPLVYAMKEEMRKEELAEEMRLFYVGMTRAKRRLYITGTYKSEDHAKDKGLADVVYRVNKYMDEYINSTNKGWSSFKLPPHIVLGVKNTLEWVFMSIAGNPEIDMGVFDINTSAPENDVVIIDSSDNADVFENKNDLAISDYCKIENVQKAENAYDSNKNESCERISRGRVWSLRCVNYEDSIINAQKILDKAPLINDTDMISESSRQGILEQDSEKPSENINTTKTENQTSAYTTTPLDILESLAKNDNEECDTRARGKEIIESNVSKAIRNKFFYEYPNARATSTPLKISVSEIKRQQQKEDELAEGTVNIFTKDSNLETTDSSLETIDLNEAVFYKKISTDSVADTSISDDKTSVISPVFMNDNSKGQTIRGINTTVHKIADNGGKELTSPQIGIAVHNFFRYANLNAIMASPDEKTIAEQLRIMEGMNMFTKEEAFELTKSIPAFQAYYTSDLACKIYAKQKENRGKVFREIPFTLKLACSEVFADKSFDTADFTYVQGIIDCWYEEDGKAVLIDYKTDHIRGSDEEIRDILQKRYQTQITVYARAIKDIKGIDVKESIIWLFNSNKQFIIKEAPDGIRLV